MVGILISFWEDPFSGAMLVSGRVDPEKMLIGKLRLPFLDGDFSGASC